MAKKDFWDLTNKPQTKTKLNILNNYLSAWAKIFGKQDWCKSIYYIDCFAGRGKYHNDGGLNVIDGSPLIALKIAKIFKEKYNKKLVCYFAENDVEVFNELQNFADVFKTNVDFECTQGDINNVIDNVLTKIPRGNPVFFFLDPKGINIKRETLEKMLAIPNIKEFLINYIQKGVERCYAFGKKSDEGLPIDIQKRAVSNLKRIQDFFGSDWQYLTDNEKRNLKVYLNVIVSFNKKSSPKNQLKAKVIDIYYNKNRNKYYLIFLSRNKRASKIIDDIYKKVKLDGTLFSILPTKEKEKMFQGKFDI